MVVPFDSQQLMQTPLIKSINLVYIGLGNCPALGTVQENGYWWIWRFVTSISGYPVFAPLHE